MNRSSPSSCPFLGPDPDHRACSCASPEFCVYFSWEIYDACPFPYLCDCYCYHHPFFSCRRHHPPCSGHLQQPQPPGQTSLYQNYTTPKKIKHKHRKVKLAVLKYYKVDDNGKINRLRR